MGLGFKLNRWGFTSVFFGLALSLGILLSISTPALAQSAAGTITGQVTDQQQAAIAGAEVKIVETSTSSTRTTTTNDVGRYTLSNVASGTYDVTVSKAGFTASRLAAQKVTVGDVLTLNVSLQIGATTTTVEVQATAGADLQTLTPRSEPPSRMSP